MEMSTAEGYERVNTEAPVPGELRLASLADGTRLCVGNSDGVLFVVQDECTHSGFPLSEGILLSGGIIQCSWHGARFDCRNGAALQEPAFEPLTCYALRLLDDGVWVRRSR